METFDDADGREADLETMDLEASYPLSRSDIAGLPGPMRFGRPMQRYRGDSHTITMDRFPTDDRECLGRLYHGLLELYRAVSGPLDSGDVDGAMRAAEGFAEMHLDATGRHAQQLGTAVPRDELPLEVRQAYHDLRGGSLQALLMQLDLIRDGLGRREDVERVYLLARDHLKMMRNAVRDLDPERYAADLEVRGHAVRLLEEKWGHTSYAFPGGTVLVGLDSGWDGDIAECCMEFSALDRVLYNLVNNAARHAADGRVRIHLVPCDTPDGTQLRIAVSNAVTPEQESALRDAHGDALGRLFEGGFTTGGHGLGMRIAAEFVVHGHGLSGVAEAIATHHVGARLHKGCFTAWIHWPAA